MLPWKE